ncbi:hypothetical protein [Paraburkholderia unamae]|uniref:Uncharacterized protein n=1 Tax=Paraburkholderia unamae TaxID=219649 RepID=A0ACC6RQA3_9BURK
MDEDAVATSTLAACVGATTFVAFGFALNLISSSLGNARIAIDAGIVSFWAMLFLWLLLLPAIALAIVPGTIVFAIAFRFKIRHASYYCVAGILIALAMLPLLSKIGVYVRRTWVQLLFEPGLRLAFSGLFAGLVLWKQVRKRFTEES